MSLKLHLVRTEQGDDSTLGRLYEQASTIDDEFLCYTLEDELREVKIPGETAIPKGRYKIMPRVAKTDMNKKYAERYGDLHVGMAWLQDVPNFKWVYIHTGNTDDHTDGCLLVGEGFAETDEGENNHIVTGSRNAYVPLYTKIAEAWEDGEDVYITITN